MQRTDKNTGPDAAPDRVIFNALLFVGGLAALGAVVAFVAQAAMWFFSGVFPRVTLYSLGFAPPLTAVWGIDKSLDWIYAQSVVWVVFMVGVGLLLLGSRLEEQYERRRRSYGAA
jgi:hypothetical protein